MIEVYKGRIVTPNEVDNDKPFAVDISIYNGQGNGVMTKQRVITLYSIKDDDLFEMLNMLADEEEDFFDMRSVDVEYVGVSKTYMVYEITIASGKINIKKVG